MCFSYILSITCMLLYQYNVVNQHGMEISKLLFFLATNVQTPNIHIKGGIEPNTEICKVIDKTWFIYSQNTIFFNFTKHNSLVLTKRFINIEAWLIKIRKSIGQKGFTSLCLHVNNAWLRILKSWHLDLWRKLYIIKQNLNFFILFS